MIGPFFDGRTWSNAESDRVVLEPANPHWPDRSEEEAAVIRSTLALGPEYRIEHFGSTAVPGLAAKPIIDIMVIPPRGANWGRLVEPLESLGYAYWAGNPRFDRMFFVKGMPPYGTGRTHHLHVRSEADSAAELQFRDCLIRHKDLAARYEALKIDLARLHSTDREAYTAGKGHFVETALESIAGSRNVGCVESSKTHHPGSGQDRPMRRLLMWCVFEDSTHPTY